MNGLPKRWHSSQISRHVAYGCPTKQYEPDQIEFMLAMQEYKDRSGRRFPTWSEVLAVLLNLGYKKEKTVMKSYRPMLESLEDRMTPTIIAPSNLTADVQNGQVILVWNDNSDNEAHFVVERSTPNGRTVQIGLAPALVPTFTDDAIHGHKTYYYRVYAVGVDGPSDYTNTVVVHNVPGGKQR